MPPEVSEFVTMCDAIADDLTSNVPELAEAIVHKYGPWAPEQGYVNVGEIHLAVWPVAEGEKAEPETNTSHAVQQLYQIIVWEQAGSEEGRQVLDEDATAEFLHLHAAVRHRLYYEPNQNLGGSARFWYSGCSFPEQASNARYFEIAASSLHFEDFWN